MSPSQATSPTVEARYQRAETLIKNNWNFSLVANSTLFPIWIEGTECFWYERDINIHKNIENPDRPLAKWDKEYRLVNARVATNKPAFDHNALALALGDAVGQAVAKDQLPLTNVKMQLNASEQVEKIQFTAFDRSWVFQPLSGSLDEAPETIGSDQKLLSPNGKLVIFSRDYNLWLQDVTTGEERALTQDGEEHYCYAVVGNGWGIDMVVAGGGLQARWSPDSKSVFTVQRDARQVLTVPMVDHVPKDGNVRPKLNAMKLAMQGDQQIPEYRLVAIDIDTGHLKAAHYPKVPVTRNTFGFFDSNLGWWGTDSRHAYFVDLARGYQTVSVVEFDTATGSTRVLFEENSDTHINLMVNADEFPTIMPLPETNELIWFSERSGWAHLYLYDLKTGALKNTITSGNWVVRNILSIDKPRRELFLHTMGRTPGRDPYYRDLVRVNIDTGKLTAIASSDDHYYAHSAHRFDMETIIFSNARDICDTRGISHSGDFAVVTRSRVDTVPVSLLVDRNGKEILELEKADMTALYSRVSEQWQWPEPVQLKAADENTDIYGMVWRPSDFSPDTSYPVISFGFNTPELPRVSKGSFFNSSSCGIYYYAGSALAELGFIVVQIDARGTPFRSKAFQYTSYGWAESAGCIDDHVAGIRQLAERYPYMDLARVGISSLGGGTGAVQGLLQHPEFFKVGVNGELHDSRLMSAPMWSDKYEGVTGPEPTHQYPEAYTDHLQGKLLLTCDMLSFSNLPATTFRLIHSLQKANKDFDLIILPTQGPEYSNYALRRSWDYFVKHLLSLEPPKTYKLSTAVNLK
jgi:dipeptidyl-peptidase-4